MQPLHRSQDDKIIAGVCGGLAETLNVPVWLIRVLFIVLGFWVGSSIPVYIVLCLILPVVKVDDCIKPRLTRSFENRMIGGVAGGLSSNMNIDVSIIRLAFIGLALWGGIGFLLYLILWIVLPNEKPDNGS